MIMGCYVTWSDGYDGYLINTLGLDSLSAVASVLN